MIRPFTCLVFLLACGSGLYLYQSKHRVKVLDEQIAQIAHSTDELRAQTRMVSAEWTLLNDPERLRQLANQFLTLQTVSPTQFTSLADLDSRLPPVPPPPSQAPTDAESGVPVAQAAPDGSGQTGTDEGKPADAKVADASQAAAPRAIAPPASARIAIATPPPEQSHPVERKPPAMHVPPAQPRIAASQPHPSDQRPPDQRQPEQRLPETRLAEVHPIVRMTRVPAPMPQTGGSLLGMAHGTGSPPTPVPLPMPVSAPQWQTSPGG